MNYLKLFFFSFWVGAMASAQEISDLAEIENTPSPSNELSYHVTKSERGENFYLFKGQKQSSVKWGKLLNSNFLSFQDWKLDRDLKDQHPEWESIVRDRNHREVVGRIYQCIGRCQVDRGEGFFNGNYRTALYEGDDIQTVGDSYLWIFLFDGTMVRLAPRSSVTFSEFNVGVKENFISARINFGNVVWLSRHIENFKEVNLRETDVLFEPFVEYETIPAEIKPKYDEDDFMALVEETETQLKHYKDLNERIQKNNEWVKNKKTYAFLVMPNATIMGYRPSLEMTVFTGGKSYFKKRSLNTLELDHKQLFEDDLFLQLRGLENKTLNSVLEDSWISVDERGRNYYPTDKETLIMLNIGEFVTKRTPRIMIGREIFLSRYSAFAFREKYDPLKLAVEDGYRLWGKLKDEDEDEESEKKEEVSDDLEKRLAFLKEFSRRVETTNLLSSAKMRERLVERGEAKEIVENWESFYLRPMNEYYQQGKKKRNDKKEYLEVEQLNSTQKLLWKKMHGIR